MFTGIVESVGRVVRVRPMDANREITIEAPDLADELEPGDSISVDGVCLTAVEVEADSFTVHAIGTTLSRTIAGTYEQDTPVNLERALRLGGRIDGHLVQGHVDGVGQLESERDAGEYRLMDFRIPEDVWEGTVLHGSIAINGISLTVNALPARCICQVGIIPYTWEHTNLKALSLGDPVNLEADLIGKYVGRMLASRGLLNAAGAQPAESTSTEGQP